MESYEGLGTFYIEWERARELHVLEGDAPYTGRVE